MNLERLIPKSFRSPSTPELAAAELDEAQRSLLAAQTAQDYAHHMVQYHNARIARLTRYVKNAGRTEKASQE
jgi:hypothetical protein